MTSRSEFVDDFSSRYDFADEFLVVCPKCTSKAKVVPSVPWISGNLHKVERKLVCSNCGYFDQKQPENGIMMHADKDWFFHQPLFYTIETSQGILYAYNDKHLDFLESFISAQLRSREVRDEGGWSNKSQISRLPKWVKLAKNRDLIINEIKKVRSRC